MNKLFLLLVAITFTVISTAQSTQQSSLGDVARKTRSQKKAPAIARYDEESFRNSAPSAPTADDKKADDADKDKDKDSAKQADGKAVDTTAKGKDADKSKDDFKAKIDAQKNEITMLQREIDVTQREQRLRAAAFYGDAGTQLRDQAKYAEEAKTQQDKIDSKKQALDAAQQKLADLEEQARKASSQ
jgi:peptidoglycan hydrolase CwlO-like protein